MVVPTRNRGVLSVTVCYIVECISLSLLSFYWTTKMWQSMTSTYDIVKLRKKCHNFFLCPSGYLCRTMNQKLLDVYFLLVFSYILFIHSFIQALLVWPGAQPIFQLCNEKCIATAIYLQLIVCYDYMCVRSACVSVWIGKN